MTNSAPILRALAALLLVLALGVVFHGEGAFFRAQLHFDLLGALGAVGLCALGQCLVILGGGIDLSVGAVVGLTGMVFAGLQLRAELPWPLALAVALAVGAVVGLANGVLVARLRVQPFLATLATMVIARGLARFVPELAGAAASSRFLPQGSEGPPFWTFLAGRLGPVPVTGILFATLAVVTAVWLQRSVFGRHLLATGANAEAARLSGVATGRVLTVTYVLAGVFAGLAGICQVARDVQGNPSAGELLELQTIAAVVIGGVSLQGGRGTLWLAILGVLILGLLEKVLALNGVPSHWRLVIQGAIILAAVLMQERRR
ncbi:MAG: ABC transporter permease [Planctomycetes bacterium]|nr:ABC transporter permease [Planctomycetota bacterium]